MSNPRLDADCPMGKLMCLLSGPWTIYILWILGEHGPTRFGSLKKQISGVSSKVLAERLRKLVDAGLLYRDYEATIPPQVTYGVTERMCELSPVIKELAAIAENWYVAEPRCTGSTPALPLGDVPVNAGSAGGSGQ